MCCGPILLPIGKPFYNLSVYQLVNLQSLNGKGIENEQNGARNTFSQFFLYFLWMMPKHDSDSSVYMYHMPFVSCIIIQHYIQYSLQNDWTPKSLVEFNDFHNPCWSNTNIWNGFLSMRLSLVSFPGIARTRTCVCVCARCTKCWNSASLDLACHRFSFFVFHSFH